jgi:hypothetical protein
MFLREKRETKHPRIILNTKTHKIHMAREIHEAKNNIVEDDSTVIMTRAKTKRRNNIRAERPQKIAKKSRDDPLVVPDSDPLTFLSSPSAELGSPKANERE